MGAQPVFERRSVVILANISWPTRGPNVDSPIGSTKRATALQYRKLPANKAVLRRSSLSVAVPESACHAGGRGFESRRSRRKYLHKRSFCCHIGECHRGSGSKRSNAGTRLEPPIGAEADANLRGSRCSLDPMELADEVVT